MNLATSMGIGAVAAVVALVGLVFYGTVKFDRACKAHGGAHTTYPYKSSPECWDAEGRRVFW